MRSGVRPVRVGFVVAICGVLLAALSDPAQAAQQQQTTAFQNGAFAEEAIAPLAPTEESGVSLMDVAVLTAAFGVAAEFASTVARSIASAVGEVVDAVPTGVLVAFAAIREEDDEPVTFENDQRAAVYDAIRDSPGSYVAEISEETDLPRSTVRYHLRVLEDEDFVETEKIRGKCRYFPTDTENQALTAVLAEDASASVLFAVARLEPANVSRIAAALDRAPSTVSHHLSRLDEDGLVERRRDGGSVLTSLSPTTRAALDGWSVTDAVAPPAGRAN